MVSYKYREYQSRQIVIILLVTICLTDKTRACHIVIQAIGHLEKQVTIFYHYATSEMPIRKSEKPSVNSDVKSLPQVYRQDSQRGRRREAQSPEISKYRSSSCSNKLRKSWAVCSLLNGFEDRKESTHR